MFKQSAAKYLLNPRNTKRQTAIVLTPRISCSFFA